MNNENDQSFDIEAFSVSDFLRPHYQDNGVLDYLALKAALAELETTESGWFFALDGNWIQIENHEYVISVLFDLTSEEYSVAYSRISDRVAKERDEILNKRIAEFKKTVDKEIVAFSGWARASFNTFAAMEVITKILQNEFSPATHAILTGGYPRGIPDLAASLARLLGFVTIAVIPERAIDSGFKESTFTFVFEEGSNWGDETFAFISLADYVIFIGGGFWTKIEFKLAKQLKKMMGFVGKFGGVADMILAQIPTEQTVHTFDIDGEEYRFAIINRGKSR